MEAILVATLHHPEYSLCLKPIFDGNAVQTVSRLNRCHAKASLGALVARISAGGFGAGEPLPITTGAACRDGTSPALARLPAHSLTRWPPSAAMS